MIKLGVNIDHVATVRQARRTPYPNLVAAAHAAERGGADGITVHLREDRRHIQDRDVDLLRAEVATKLNLEMAATAEMVRKACSVRPADVCIVPEKREELTTEGGLDAAGQLEGLGPVVAQLRAAGIRVSLFIDPEAPQIEAARRLQADAVEIHTGAYADAASEGARAAELHRIQEAASRAHAAGLIVNAGHGLTLDNVTPIAAIPLMNELNIGHSIVADAIFVGIEEAVRRLKTRMLAARSR
ncbi:MAG TPA: pyridoxine 5'-phosphate synthase [Candidatus Margulisiibacteriota bacterium]|nr:pyridoxine 5'-phosphate synthase [Candidatus Margulisiibacteriota bacterium]